MTVTTFRGRKGSSGSAPTAKPDTLRSKDTVEVILGICNGPIEGLEDGAKSFYIDETPLQGQDGASNFDGFTLEFYPGSALGDEIKPHLGGFGNPTTVTTNLSQNIPVTRSGQQTQIDYIDVRLQFLQLWEQNSQGTTASWVEFKVEYKAQSSGTWKNAFPDSDPGEGTPNYFLGRNQNWQEPKDAGIYHQPLAPADPQNGALWFDSDNNDAPHEYNGESWQPLTVTDTDPDYVQYTYHGKTRRAWRPLNRFPENDEVSRNDVWLAPDGAYVYNGESWEDGIPDLDITVASGVIRLTGKTTSLYVKELRFPVARIDEFYDIRVTKVSQDTGPMVGTVDNDYACDMAWESFQEITAEPYRFTNLAVAHLLARASDQFSSLPQFSGVYKGLKVRVPTNYNPETRTYTGAWDGTYKKAWTDNPAWILLDFISDDSYGFSSYYPIELDKWDIYEAARWCDDTVDDGGGPPRPRFTFNALLSETMSGRELANYIAGSFAARFFEDGNGYARLKVDKDDTAVALFAPENVVNGEFKYSFSDITTRHNDYTVTFVNPDLGWKPDKVRVFDTEHVEKYGRIPADFQAVGCISRAEAKARARYKLITGLTETTMVQFSPNRIGGYLQPYDIILIADPKNGYGESRRLKSVVSSNTFTVRDPISLESGVAYQAKVQIPNSDYPNASDQPFEVLTYTIAAASIGVGATTQITVTGNLPASLPDRALVTFEAAAALGLPKPFRILKIEQGDNGPDDITITALEVNRTKWAYIDGTVDTITEPHYSVFEQAIPLPPRNVTVRAERRRYGESTIQSLIIDWDRSPTKFVRRYKVYSSLNDDPMVLIGETEDTTFEWIGVVSGNYRFAVTAVNLGGKESTPAFASFNLTGKLRVPAKISNLRLVSEKLPDIFTTRSPTFVWDHGKDDPYFRDYLVEILDPDSGAIARDVYITGRRFVYEYDHNASDHEGVPARHFTVRVRKADQFGNLSNPTDLEVINPVPGPPVNLLIEYNAGAIVVRMSKPTDKDFAGIRVHMSTTNDFLPNDLNIVYEGLNNNIVIPKVLPGRYYFRVAIYDTFGDNDLDYSEQHQVDVLPDVLTDTIPPGKPTNLRATAGFKTAILNWDNPSDPDLDFIEVWRNSVNNLSSAAPVGSAVGEGYADTGLTNGTTYYYWVRAVDWSRNKSDFTESVSVTTVRAVEDDIRDAAITAAKIHAEALDATHFASTIKPIEIVENLPTANNTEGRTVYLTTDDKLYRWNGTAWTAAVPAADITGQLVEQQLADASVAAAKLKAGAVDASKFASSIKPVEVVNTLPNTGNTVGRIVFLTSNNKLYRWTGTAWTATIPATDVSGQLASGQIANGAITGAKINTGAIDASKFAGNIRPVEIVSALPTSGNVVGRTVYLTTNDKIYRWTGTAWTARTDAADVFGQLTAGQIAAGAIGTEQLAANAVRAQHILAGEISAEKIAVGWSNLVVNGGFEDGLEGWSTTLPISYGAATRCTGKYAGYIAANSSYSGNTWVTGNSLYFDCAPDDKFHLSFRVTYTGAVPPSNSYVQIYISFRDGDGNQIYSGVVARVDTQDVNAVGGGSYWVTARAITGVPAGGVNGVIMLSVYNHTTPGSYWNWDDIVCTRATTGLLLDNGSVTASKIGADQITAVHIASEQVSTEHLAADSITTGKMKAGSVTTAQLAADAVTADKIAATQIAAGHLAAEAVTTDKLAANAVTAGKIAAGQIQAEHLGAGSVTTDKLEANSVTAGKISAGAVGADQIAANGVRAQHIAAGEIAAEKLAVGWSTLVENGTFERGLKGWATYRPIEISTLSGANGNICRVAGSSSYSNFAGITDNFMKFDVSPGDKFYVGFRATYSGASPPSDSFVYVTISFEDAFGNIINSGQTAAVSTSDVNVAGGGANWVSANTIVTRPSGAVRGYVLIAVFHHTNTSAYWNWDDVVATRATTGVLIDNGAVTADKVLARSLTGDRFIAGTITADEIGAGQITTSHINTVGLSASVIKTGTLDANRIGTRSLTADRIRVGTLTYNEVGLNQMTVPVFSYSASEVVVPSGAATTHSVGLTTIGRPVQIFVSVEAKKDSSGMAAFDIAIKRDGATLVTYSTDIYGEYMVRTVAFVDVSPGAGARTYSVVASGLEGVTARYRRRMITVSEVRR